MLSYSRMSFAENDLQEIESMETVAPGTINLSIPMNKPPTEDEKYAIQSLLENRFNVPKDMSTLLSNQIADASYMYEIAASILIAVIKVESAFDPYAISHANARGYTQVMPKWWDSETPYDLHLPEQNVLAGAFVLDKYRNRCGDIYCALKSYNIGITAYLAGENLAAARKYISKIMRAEDEVLL
tara:strand:- start:934 stop:1488 length:555 start_codon:yes stop_codon:yes gene_type:complete